MGSPTDYAPQTNVQCPNDPPVRVFSPSNQSLNELESDYVLNRQQTVIPDAWKAWLGDGSAIGYNLSLLSANLPKVTMSAPTAPQEEGVNFFAAKDSDEADRLVQTQRVTKERPANASSGGFDLSWLWAPLMSYPRDTWFGLVLALIWIGQMLVEPFELMIVAALIWEVQGEANPVPV